MNATFGQPPRRGTAASLAAAALVGLLTVSTGPSPVVRVLDSPGRKSAPAIPSAGASGAGGRDGTTVRIELVAGGEIATATLDDTPEARAFAAMLPITLDMEDPFGQAKTGQLPRALPLEDARRSRSYAAGDLSYWPPSGKLAIVYDALGRSVPPPGLVRLGTVQTGLEAIGAVGSDFTITIRRGP